MSKAALSGEHTVPREVRWGGINESTGTGGEGEGAWGGPPHPLGSVYCLAYLLGAKENFHAGFGSLSTCDFRLR